MILLMPPACPKLVSGSKDVLVRLLIEHVILSRNELIKGRVCYDKTNGVYGVFCVVINGMFAVSGQ